MHKEMMSFESEGYSPSTPGADSDPHAFRHARPVPWRWLVGLTLLLQLVVLLSLSPLMPADAGVLPVQAHLLLELCAIIVAAASAMVGWAGADHRAGFNAALLGAGLGVAALLGAGHVLYWPGMPGVSGLQVAGAYDLSLNFALLSRYAMVGALLFAALDPWPRLGRPVRLALIASALAVVLLAAGASVASPPAWLQPVLAALASGPPRVAAGYGATGLALLAAWHYYRRTTLPQLYDATSLFGAAVVLALSELCFTVYARHDDVFVLLGHSYKIFACLLIYRALFVSGMVEPYARLRAERIDNQSTAHLVEYLAYHEPLTSLPNRLLLKEHVTRTLAPAGPGSLKTVLLLVDLDNFKTVNDVLGHSAGDALLAVVARRLADGKREGDTVGSLGGDKFLVVLRDLSGGKACLPAVRRIIDSMRQPFDAAGHSVNISASIGIAVGPDDGASFEALSHKAEMAMYSAKAAGRNTWRFFEAQMDAEAAELLRMHNGLRTALAQGELELYYQPQLDLATGRVTGAEALLRWHHPELGMVSPARFIPVAEDSGLIVPIGAWVLREACRQAQAWRAAGLPDIVVSANLSAVQFSRGDVERSVNEALAESRLPPALLELELTESILIKDTDAVLVTIQKLKAAGVKLSIDDFGSGYSSFAYLTRFDVDRLKIDRSFIQGLQTDPDNATIVHAIIQLAHNLGLRTIAEGVEDEAALRYLKQVGCDEVQGYYYARPMPADDFARYLAAGGGRRDDR